MMFPHAIIFILGVMWAVVSEFMRLLQPHPERDFCARSSIIN